MSRRERAKKSRRRTKVWLYRGYVGLPKGIRRRTDPVVRRINKSKPTHRERSKKGKGEVVKRVKRLAKNLDRRRKK